MDKNVKYVKFQVEDMAEVPNWADTYDENKFAIYRCCFLSTRPNSHEIPITEKILREYAKTILGNFLVAKIERGDATTHTYDEIIYGYAPKEQNIEFVKDGAYLKAYCYFVVSKRYSKEFNGIFEFDNVRDSSVEMTISYADDGETVIGIDIYGLTCLGKTTAGSCPDADIKLVRFSEKKATSYFAKHKKTNLQKFIEERKANMAMAKKTYKIDKSKEAMSNADWGKYDKAAMRDKIMEAENRDELVKEVYALVEDGWETAPSEHLKYPLMILENDTFVYNRTALSSALAYAKQNDEQSVIDKVEKIYKDLDLDDSDGKEDNKMSEIQFSAVNIGEMWGQLWNAMQAKREWNYYIDAIYEEDNQKFAIISDDEFKRYRLNFSLTEEGLTLADEIIEIKTEFIETDNMQKFAEPENVDDYRKSDDSDDDCDDDAVEKLTKRIAELESDIEKRDAIIMEKDAELEELRKFKADIEEKEKALSVEAIMDEVKEYFDEDKLNEMRQSGLACGKDEIDGWANSVKAIAFASVKKQSGKAKRNVGVWSFAASNETHEKKKSSIWD